MPPSLAPPLGRLGIGERFNRTLHGRSRFRPEDVPGHNVFYGYSRPGWGDALDLLCPGGTPVYALEACRQVLHRNDATRLEVITLQGAGFVVLLAHINAVWAGRGHRFRRGFRPVGVLGVLLAAKRRGLLPELAPVLDALRTAGFYFSDALGRQVLAAAGEDEP